MAPPVKMLLQRSALGLLSLWLISVLIFFAVELLPGDFAQEILGQAATPETVSNLRRELGLDAPMLERYFTWLGNALRGDFGTSLANGRPVSELIGTRLGNTFALAVYAAAIAVPLAVGLGLLSALYRNSLFDRLANTGALTAISFPEFFVAYLLIFLLAGPGGAFSAIVNLRGDPSFVDFLDQAFLPALTLTLVITAHMMRMTRAAIINLLASPYIEMARLKGVTPWRIIVIHALPNALAPVINVIALNLAYLITGVVVVEVIFSYPGLGQLMVESVTSRNMPVVQAIALIFAGVYVMLNLVADLLSTLTNPRLMRRR